ncbi:Pullulanase [compost metagenome]
MVDGSLKVADPYSELTLDPYNDKDIPTGVFPSLKAYPTGKTTGIVSVAQSNVPAYVWKNTTFTRPEKSKLVIYELHMRDFLSSHSYSTLRDTLNYFSSLGVNAIELMPVNEFENNSSWGYNPSFYFSPDKYYGTKNMLKEVIDECHKRGIAVILDMVLNHSFGQSPMVQLYFDTKAGKPTIESPWFNQVATHPFNVGYDFNHESADTKYFTKNVMKFWMEEYKVDGFRFDLSKGFTQKNSGTDDSPSNVNAWSAYDASRIAIWKDYNNYIKSIDPNFYVILEHLGVDQEEKELANEGMLLWNNMNWQYAQNSMGYYNKDADITRANYTSHGFNQPNLITYMESHDEERLMFKNKNYSTSSGTYNVKNLATGLKRQEAAAAFLFTVPGPNMLWQFGELGYDISINEGGRTGEKPILWNYYSDPNRKALRNVFVKLIKLKTKTDALQNATYTSAVNNTAVKYLIIQSGTTKMVVIANFDVVEQQANVTFPAAGTWYEYVGSGSGTINLPTTTYNTVLQPGEYHVYTSTVINP